MLTIWPQAAQFADKADEITGIETKMMLGMPVMITTTGTMPSNVSRVEKEWTTCGAFAEMEAGRGQPPPSRAAYESTTEGTFIAYEPADYVRLRTHSDSDPFIGIPHGDGEWPGLHWNTNNNQSLIIENNDPFSDLDEELPWLETFTDLNQYENQLQSPIDEEIEKRTAEIDWIEWDRFLRENHPFEYQLGSGASSPVSSSTAPCCDDYIPNFEVIDSGRQNEEEQIDLLPTGQITAIEAFPEDFEIIEEFFETEEQPEKPKPKRGRPRLPKPQRAKRSARYSPFSDEEEDPSNPSDVRRRALNRDAAFRYRERKRAEKEAAHAEAQELESRHTWLMSRVSTLTNEISRMRAHLQDMGAI